MESGTEGEWQGDIQVSWRKSGAPGTLKFHWRTTAGAISRTLHRGLQGPERSARPWTTGDKEGGKIAQIQQNGHGTSTQAT